MTNEPELVRAFVAEHGRAIYKSISSDATDYRYARAQTGEAASMEPCELDAQLAARCVALADGLGLDLAGIDLRITPAGEAICFEVNPSPVYSCYEAHTGQPMAAAITRQPRGRSRLLSVTASSTRTGKRRCR